MGDLRIWLDRKKIALFGFELVTLGVGNIAFEAQFGDAGHAALFRAAFGGVAEPFSSTGTAANRPTTGEPLARRRLSRGIAALLDPTSASNRESRPKTAIPKSVVWCG
jgi:hypothetical protein